MSVNTNDIVDFAVTTKKIHNHSITTSKLKNCCVTTEKICDGAITVDKLDRYTRYTSFGYSPIMTSGNSLTINIPITTVEKMVTLNCYEVDGGDSDITIKANVLIKYPTPTPSTINISGKLPLSTSFLMAGSESSIIIECPVLYCPLPYDLNIYGTIVYDE